MLIVLLCFPDVFYYLKDPPPGFLPRLGTITMAGLLGMFLARKGNFILSYCNTLKACWEQLFCHLLVCLFISAYNNITV